MRYLIYLLLMWPILGWSQAPVSPEEDFKKLAWQIGPTEGRISNKATIAVPSGYVFLDEKNTRRFLELAGNPPKDGYYLLAPDSLKWFSVFSFNPTGYIKDDEKIDPDELLKTLKKSDGAGNEERKRLGMPLLYTDGWQVAPHYDAQTKRLEWGMRLRQQDGKMLVNYTSRLLGRSGVMSAVLVSDVASLPEDTEQFRAALEDFRYVPGERYSEFKQGDKVAEYGLAALILGGTAAVATKKGFWAVIAGFLAAFWKVLAGLAVAAVVGIGSLFRRKRE
ncbi:MAG: DUF2167 domain-containing protein [Candidatus Accumulibacter sp.]|uniref:DUF2167 domain-containing protein n=1 Tax=Accumulibacter sp. TaxID=2053492 RepID=UPI00287A491B|nr:DUF2167 domain-containing protein [Accumulibacter sp.]MDS4016313.1 DUF2167 domain-containing protein [Accumulibacter sp.]